MKTVVFQINTTILLFYWSIIKTNFDTFSIFLLDIVKTWMKETRN